MKSLRNITLTFVALAPIIALTDLMPDLKPPILITQQLQLAEMLDRVRGHTSIAADTESDSLYVYREKVCLIQVSIPGLDYLIDPLSGIDLKSIGQVLSDPKIQTVFHAAEYDVICLRRDYGFTFANLFDTMWAARILGWPHVGLGDIMQEKFDVTLDKHWQRHNWGKRPIEPAALSYARFDTHYLLRLQDVQLRELHQLDRLEEAQEVFADLAQSESTRHTFEPDDFWRIKGVWDLGGRAQTILRQLNSLRDREARRQNRPPFKVFGDKTLIALAERSPHKIEQLQSIEGLSELLIKRYGPALLEAVERGRHAPIPMPPSRSVPDQAVLARYEKLRTWRKQVAAQRGVEPDVIVGNAVLMEIAQRCPHAPSDIPPINWFGPWRRRTYGQALIDAISDL